MHTPKPNPLNLCWLDMEMTGLNPEHDRIIEAAVVVTDADLNILAQSESYAIHQSDELLKGMDAWNTSTHERTGLTQRVKDSTLSEAEVEQRLLDFVAQWTPPGTSPLCGNTVHQDRRFMQRYTRRRGRSPPPPPPPAPPQKTPPRRWHPTAYKSFSKKGSHRALDDILESIEELRHYRQTFLRLPEANGTNREAT